jgi:hypothetical protein
VGLTNALVDVPTQASIVQLGAKARSRHEL